MTDEELRQTINEVREMKKICGNINMKLTNIVTQRGQDFKKKLEAEYQRGLEDGKVQSECRCEGCEYKGKTDTNPMCSICSNNYKNYWTAKSDKIEVGDEVEVLNSGNKYLIAWFAGTSLLCGFAHDGATCRLQPSDVRKTGRHFDIKSILEAMKHD